MNTCSQSDEGTGIFRIHVFEHKGKAEGHVYSFTTHCVENLVYTRIKRVEKDITQTESNMTVMESFIAANTMYIIT